ncbi:MAG: 1-acyl-sn-glycerol-3-phosphate acyltransferase [Myxococcales bacterium]|nr:1-acyl-sn-glycerol-3-phosphate acyltransferase [Myxococcales bacterium]
MAGEAPRSYEPNPALAWMYARFFDHIEIDEAWVARVREADRRGTVVYVLRNLSFVDFLALDHLTKRHGLPEVRFANDLGLWILEPMGRGWLRALAPRSELDDVARLRTALDAGASAALFLKRPPTALEPAPLYRGRAASRQLPTRGRIEGDAFLRELLEAQRAAERPILLVPQVFVWSRRPDQAERSPVDAVFGPREWPGKIRTVAQFLMNYRHVSLRAGEPVDLGAFLAQESTGSRDPDDDARVVRRLTYVLLRRLERERRSVIGPTKKPADRMRDQVVRSARLQKVIRDLAGEGTAERKVLTVRALSMLRDMEALVDPNALTALDAAFDATVARMYSGVEVDQAGLARLREASKDGSLVLLPSHKSHVDYIILSRLFHRANMPVPLVAAGDNLAFFPLGPVLRRAGAFFIRRSFRGDRLYGAVVDAYMRRLLKDGWPLEFFLEGGRSRTGKLLAPKLGLLSIVVDAVLGSMSDSGRKVYFCPISIGYERIVEERAYVREVTGGEKQSEDVRGLLGAAQTAAVGRYGKLNVQFGEPLTLEDVLREIDPASETNGAAKLSPAKRRALVSRLAYRVMNEINRVTAVTPSALAATALLTHGRRGISHVDLMQVCERIARLLAREGARFTPSLDAGGDPLTIRSEAIREACDLFVRAGHIECHAPGAPVGDRSRSARPGLDAIYVVPDEGRLSLDIPKNLVVQFFVSRATVITALAPAERDGPMPMPMLRDRVLALSRLFKHEFQFRADAPFEQIFAETCAQMEQDGEIVTEGADEHRTASLPGAGDGREAALLYARVLRSFLEGYRVAARSLVTLLKGPLAPKDLAKRAIGVGERMFLSGEIELRESVSRPVIDNAFHAFVDLGSLARRDGKLALPDSYDTPETVGTVESRIASYLT